MTTKTKVKPSTRDPRSAPLPIRRVRLGFMRKWDMLLCSVALVAITVSLVVQNYIWFALLFGVLAIHLASRFKEERRLDGSDNDMYPLESGSKQYTLISLAVVGLVGVWLLLIGLLPLELHEVASSVGLIYLAIYTWITVQFLCSLFPQNKFTTIFPFTVFVMGIINTVVYGVL